MGAQILKEYITQQDDVLDLICRRHYGVSSGTTERVLIANPHLKNLPVRLPMGVKITLPVLSPPKKRRIKLWD
jgi:phage tail protein X